MDHQTATEPVAQDTAQAVRSVLVVDDSASQRMTLSGMLRRLGYSVRAAESGLAALRACREEPPDLIFSDWMMPQMDGLTFCREFRKMTRDSYGYFILLTVKGAKEDVARGFDAGADDFLTKPVNGAELRARITAAERVLRMERQLTEKNRLIRATLEELQRLYDSIKIDLVAARRLQQSLVRERHRNFGRARVSLLLHTCGHVGGDLVGMFPIGEDGVGLYAIDVSGHGISSALMTARLAGYLSATAPEQNVALKRRPRGGYAARCPAETAAILNELILSEIETEHYFTLLLANVDLPSGEVVFVQAGHPCPLIQRADGTIEMAGRGGMPVGLLRNATYAPARLRLRPGDRLLVHSDGLTECAAPDGALLGEAGLARIMTRLAGLSDLRCLDGLVWELSEHAGKRQFGDDVSAVLLEYTGG
ncbi:MAG: SpoIIE family protein phosphatase [Roseovarius sp.]